MNNKLDRIAMGAEIKRLKSKQSIEWLLLKSQWHETLPNINMSRIVQESLVGVIATKPASSGLIKNVIGLSTGYLINKLYPKKPGGLLSKVSKLSLEFVAGKFLANHSNLLLKIGINILKSSIKKLTN
jgi:hypothetical protein